MPISPVNYSFDKRYMLPSKNNSYTALPINPEAAIRGVNKPVLCTIGTLSLGSLIGGLSYFKQEEKTPIKDKYPIKEMPLQVVDTAYGNKVTKTFELVKDKNEKNVRQLVEEVIEKKDTIETIDYRNPEFDVKTITPKAGADSSLIEKIYYKKNYKVFKREIYYTPDNIAKKILFFENKIKSITYGIKPSVHKWINETDSINKIGFIDKDGNKILSKIVYYNINNINKAYYIRITAHQESKDAPIYAAIARNTVNPRPQVKGVIVKSKEMFIHLCKSYLR